MGMAGAVWRSSPAFDVGAQRHIRRQAEIGDWRPFRQSVGRQQWSRRSLRGRAQAGARQKIVPAVRTDRLDGDSIRDRDRGERKRTKRKIFHDRLRGDEKPDAIVGNTSSGFSIPRLRGHRTTSRALIGILSWNPVPSAAGNGRTDRGIARRLRPRNTAKEFVTRLARHDRGVRGSRLHRFNRILMPMITRGDLHAL